MAPCCWSWVLDHPVAANRVSRISQEKGKKRKREKRKKRNLQRSWSLRKRRSPLLVLEDWGFCAIGFGRKKEFAVEKSRFG